MMGGQLRIVDYGSRYIATALGIAGVLAISFLACSQSRGEKPPRSSQDVVRKVSRNSAQQIYVHAHPDGSSPSTAIGDDVYLVMVNNCRVVRGYLHPWCHIRTGSVTGWVNGYYLAQ